MAELNQDYSDSTPSDSSDAQALIEHARRMHEEEREQAEYLSRRGRVMMASCAGVFSFIAAAFFLGKPLDRLASPGWWDSHHALLAIFIISLIIMGWGIMRCGLGSMLFLSHHEDEARTLNRPTSFAEMSLRWFETQPNTRTVNQSYLFETTICSAYSSPMCGLLRLHLIGIGLQSTHRIQLGRIRMRLPGPLALSVWLHYELPGTHLPRLWRDRIERAFSHFTSYILLHDSNNGPDATEADDSINLVGAEFPIDVSGSAWRQCDVEMQRLLHPHSMIRSDTYYTQFAEAFCIEHCGIGDDSKRRFVTADRFYHDVRKGSHPFTTATWRVFVSEYFASQQLRTKNWNYFFRIKQAERYFRKGITFILVGFLGSTAIAAIQALWLSAQL